MSNAMLHAALEYAKNGFSVIPCGKDKAPLIKWLPYQEKHPAEEEIKERWNNDPKINLAVVTGPISNILVVDIDVVTKNGFVSLIEAGIDLSNILTPVAETPSGGQHWYFRYPEGENITVGVDILPGVDFRGAGGVIVLPPSYCEYKKGNKEIKGRYSWLKDIADVPIAPLPEFLLQCIKGSFSNNNYSLYRDVTDERRGSVTKRYEALQDVTISLDEGGRDNSLFHIANCLIKGGMSEGNASYILDIMAQNCNPPFPEKEITAKIRSAIQRARRRERNFQDEVEEWVSVTSGYWNVTECNQALQSVTKEEKTAVRVAVHRLHKAGKIERHGEKDGCYRRVETEVEPVNFLTASTDEFSIIWPLGIDEHCIIYPGNIIVIAGSKSAGKTGFLLNTVKLNMRRHEIVYFNSEMGDTEFRKRLELFEDMKLSEWKFKPYHRSSGFSDLITPEKKIYIVDFLEVTTDFWKVAQYIQEIHKKLKDGICIIALQKSDAKDTGRGGDFSKEKSRLYLSLDYLRDERVNRVKITDAKAWRTDKNPRGMYRDYHLIKGAKYKPVSGWQGA